MALLPLPMPIVANLRSRFTGDPNSQLGRWHETAVNFIAAPSEKRARLENQGTLNPRGMAEAMRTDLAKVIVPELRRISGELVKHRQVLQDRRKALSAMPKPDPTDLDGIHKRYEIRQRLARFEPLQLVSMLMADPDPLVLAAALDGSLILLGLTAQQRGQIEQVYVDTHHRKDLKDLDDQQEVVEQVNAAVQIATIEVQKQIGYEGREFAEWWAKAA